MTNSKCDEFDGVRKVRLKTESGVLTLCYRSSQSSREAEDSQDASSGEKVSQGGSQVSGVGKESGFGSLPELFELSDQFSIGEGFDGCSASSLDLRPDFSAYSFWASDVGQNLPHAVGLSDTFSRCNLAGMMDHAALGSDPIVDDADCPEGHQNCATKQDPHFQSGTNGVFKSATNGEMNTKLKSHWDLPLELEEDIFESANYCNLLKEVSNERDVNGEIVVDDFLVDRTPDFGDDIDTNILVYAPNRYLEDTACIFQSAPVELESGIQTLWTVGGHRIQDSQKGSREMRGTVREECLKDGQSMVIKSINSDTTASCIEELDNVQEDVIAKHPRRDSTADKARVLRVYDFVNHRRRRFSAYRGKRSKFPKRTTLTSLDKRSPNQASLETKPGLGLRLIRSPIRKSEPARRLFKAAASSSESQSAGESDHNCDKTSLRVLTRQISVLSDPRKPHAGPTAETSQGKSARCLVKDTLDTSSTKVAPPLRFSPLKDILNSSFDREDILKTGSNPCLLRKKRTKYADVFHSPGGSTKLGTRLPNELSPSQDSPKKMKCSEVSTPRDSPTMAQFRSPKVSRKKVRTCRKRPPQGSPTPAKKLHFHGKFVHEGASEVRKGKSPQREGQLKTKSAERKGRQRLPLPPNAREILQGWLSENLQDPYPSRPEKEDLLFQTGLKMSQIDNWLGNARQKLKLKSRAVKDLCSDSSLSPEQPRKQSKRIARSCPMKRL